MKSAIDCEQITLRIAEAAAATSLSERTIASAISSGALASFKLGRAVLIRPSDLAAWATGKSRQTGAEAPASPAPAVADVSPAPEIDRLTDRQIAQALCCIDSSRLPSVAAALPESTAKEVRSAITKMHFLDRDLEGVAQAIRQHCRDGAGPLVASLSDGLATLLLGELIKRFPRANPPGHLIITRSSKELNGGAQ